MSNIGGSGSESLNPYIPKNEGITGNSKEQVKKHIEQNTEEIAKDLNLDNSPAKVLGEVQANFGKVKKAGLDLAAFPEELVKNITKDMNFLNKNPEVVKASIGAGEKLFGKTNNYKDALKLEDGIIQEFADK